MNPKPANVIVNPFTKGQTFTIPAGTVVSGTKVRKIRSATTVTLRSATDGYVDLISRGPAVRLPKISWAGTSGRWELASVTPELCETLGIDMPPLPDLDGRFDNDNLVIAYGPDTDDRWAVGK